MKKVTRGFRMRVCRDGEWCKHPGKEGRCGVASGTGGVMKGWGEILKRKKNEAAEQKFPGQRGHRIIFSKRFETLHCLKLKMDVGQNFL